MWFDNFVYGKEVLITFILVLFIGGITCILLRKKTKYKREKIISVKSS